VDFARDQACKNALKILVTLFFSQSNWLKIAQIVATLVAMIQAAAVLVMKILFFKMACACQNVTMIHFQFYRISKAMFARMV